MVQWHTSKLLWTQQESFFSASVHEGLSRLVNHVMRWEPVRGVASPSASVSSACWDTYIKAPLWAISGVKLLKEKKKEKNEQGILKADRQTGLAVAVRGAEVQF